MPALARRSVDPAKLLSARRRAGLNQAQLAVAAGVSVNTLSTAESHGLLSPSVAGRLAVVLQVDPQELGIAPTLRGASPSPPTQHP